MQDGYTQGVCQLVVWPGQTMVVTNNTFMENLAMLSHSSGTIRGLPTKDSRTTGSGVNADGSGISCAARVLQLIAWHVSGNPMHHEDFLTKLQTSCSHL